MMLSDTKFKEWDQRKKARFINSLAGFKSANLIGTKSALGEENLAIVSSVIHFGANLPLIGFVNRPNTVERHTLENILETGFFTINAVTQEFHQAAHHTSARYGRGTSEFEQCGLKPEYINNFYAPFVDLSPMKMAVRLVEHHTIQANQTEMVIGEIVSVEVEESAIQPDGYIDVEQLNLVTISGLDSYHETQRINRLEYAKPNVKAGVLNVDGSQSQNKQ